MGPGLSRALPLRFLLPVHIHSFLARDPPPLYSLSKPGDALGGRNASLVCIKHAALTNFLTARRHRAHPPSDYDGILALSAGSDYAQLCAYGRRRAVLCEKPSYYGYYSRRERPEPCALGDPISFVPSTLQSPFTNVYFFFLWPPH